MTNILLRNPLPATLLAASLLTPATGAIPASVNHGTSPSPSTFELAATQQNFKLYFPTYLANGFLSAQSSLRGTDATLALMVGLMDYTPDDISRPAAIPSWTEIDYFDGRSWLNSAPVTAAAFRNYRQTLDMRDGMLTTRYVWMEGGKSTGIAVTTFVSEDSSHLAVTSIRVTPDFDGRIRLRFTLRPWPATAHRLALGRLTWPQVQRQIAPQDARQSGDSAHPARDQANGNVSIARPVTPPADRAAIWYPGEVAVHSQGVSDQQRVLWIEGRAMHGAEFAEAAALAVSADLADRQVSVEKSHDVVALNIEGGASKGKTYEFTKFFVASGNGWGGSFEQDVQAARSARNAGLKAALDRHVAVWHGLWSSDIEITGDDALQRAIHSDLFYLLENSSLDTAWPMGACGFSANYFQHVFWDNDSWDFPVLLLLHPERARSQIAFRSRTLAAAEQRARQHGYKGAMYPWESDPARGNDETPYFAHENALREIHVNGDVAIAQWQYYLATQDKDWLRENGYPVIRATAQFWESRVKYQSATARYEILHVTSPDEAYDDVANDSFTNAIAQRNLSIASAAAAALGVAADRAWNEIAQKLYIPFSASQQRHLDFDPSVVHDKQTWMGSALVFLAYPQLDLPMSPTVRRNDFDFAVRSLKELAPDANAMLLSMLSIEAAELGDARAADAWLQRQESGFLKPPFNVRSETVLNNATYILATSAGFLQNFLYGFTGLRVTDSGLASRYAPVLPGSWKQLTLRNLTFQGRHFDYVLSRDASGKVRASRPENDRPRGRPTLHR